MYDSINDSSMNTVIIIDICANDLLKFMSIFISFFMTGTQRAVKTAGTGAGKKATQQHACIP